MLSSIIDNNPDLQAVVPASHTHTVMAIAAAVAIQTRDFFRNKKPLFEKKFNVEEINGSKEKVEKKVKEEDIIISEDEEKQEMTGKEIAVEVSEVVVTITEEDEETDDKDVELTGVEEFSNVDVNVTSVAMVAEKEKSITKEEEEMFIPAVEKEEVIEENLEGRKADEDVMMKVDEVAEESQEEVIKELVTIEEVTN